MVLSTTDASGSVQLSVLACASFESRWASAPTMRKGNLVLGMEVMNFSRGRDDYCELRFPGIYTQHANIGFYFCFFDLQSCKTVFLWRLAEQRINLESTWNKSGFKMTSKGSLSSCASSCQAYFPLAVSVITMWDTAQHVCNDSAWFQCDFPEEAIILLAPDDA